METFQWFEEEICCARASNLSNVYAGPSAIIKWRWNFIDFCGMMNFIFCLAQNEFSKNYKFYQNWEYNLIVLEIFNAVSNRRFYK